MASSTSELNFRTETIRCYVNMKMLNFPLLLSMLIIIASAVNGINFNLIKRHIQHPRAESTTVTLDDRTQLVE